jgi:hypothetical protein
MAVGAYRTTFSKHLWNLAASGFYTRGLDADDYAFLEHVRKSGVANGTLPNVSAVLVEELEFWHMPYALDQMPRRIGPVPKRVRETPEQAALRKIRSNAWHARRAILKHDRMIAAAELERERLEWVKRLEQQRLREQTSDDEWEAAAPRKKKRKLVGSRSAPFGAVVNRHYVPQWKLDERAAEREAERAAAKAARAAEVEAAATLAARAASAARAARIAAAEMAAAAIAEAKAAVERAEQQAEAAAPARQQAEQSIKGLELERQRHAMTARLAISRPQLKQQLKQQLEVLIKNTSPYVWSLEELMRSTGCDDREFVIACLDEMVRDGRLSRVSAARRVR